MAKGELLANSKFYITIEGFEDLIVKSVSGITTTLEVAGSDSSYGVTKDGKSFVQATVTGVSNSNITVSFVGTADDKRLFDWWDESHSREISGGGSAKKGERKAATVTLYNQGGEPAAEWQMTGVFPVKYSGTQFSPDSAELYVETIEFAYEGLHRIK
ncbi:phage tail protein [Spirulina sp. CCNP1310]|uniref:phage tail protein n=1 Tax=Spirulina sp. CCNP1310 TaxID=3110249 RepID=UPI002B206EF1|nr:phage tail protein [Spirulina sp. CCNP1310]MEA5420566.1 phage tail protein [Spirulina sp. CCNP1310]